MIVKNSGPGGASTSHSKEKQLESELSGMVDVYKADAHKYRSKFLCYRHLRRGYKNGAVQIPARAFMRGVDKRPAIFGNRHNPFARIYKVFLRSPFHIGCLFNFPIEFFVKEGIISSFMSILFMSQNIGRLRRAFMRAANEKAAPMAAFCNRVQYEDLYSQGRKWEGFAENRFGLGYGAERDRRRDDAANYGI